MDKVFVEAIKKTRQNDTNLEDLSKITLDDLDEYELMVFKELGIDLTNEKLQEFYRRAIKDDESDKEFYEELDKVSKSNKNLEKERSNQENYSHDKILKKLRVQLSF